MYKLRSGKFKCGRCRREFTEFSGTYISRLHISFNDLVYLIHVFVLGVPAYRIAREVGINRVTAERLFRVFREAIYDHGIGELKRLSGKLELDEAMFGGHKKGKRGWGASGKHLVFGIYQRNGNVITFPVPDRRAETLIPLIEKHTRRGSIYYTDDYEGYVSLVVRGKHVRIMKDKGRPLKENINGVEGFWSYAKTWLYHYRGVPKKYFHLYLKEIEFRFNNRNENLFDILAKMLVDLVA
jgi:transposase